MVTDSLGWDSEESKACRRQHASLSASAWRKLREQLLRDSTCYKKPFMLSWILGLITAFCLQCGLIATVRIQGQRHVLPLPTTLLLPKAPDGSSLTLFP